MAPVASFRSLQLPACHGDGLPRVSIREFHCLPRHSASLLEKYVSPTSAIDWLSRAPAGSFDSQASGSHPSSDFTLFQPLHCTLVHVSELVCCRFRLAASGITDLEWPHSGRCATCCSLVDSSEDAPRLCVFGTEKSCRHRYWCSLSRSAHSSREAFVCVSPRPRSTPMRQHGGFSTAGAPSTDEILELTLAGAKVCTKLRYLGLAASARCQPCVHELASSLDPRPLPIIHRRTRANVLLVDFCSQLDPRAQARVLQTTLRVRTPENAHSPK
jgi:hypothetical protein